MATERPSPILNAIVLAAGAGSRFGGGKLTAPWRGGRLIDGALGAAFSAPVSQVIVVTGADDDVEQAVMEFAWRDARACRSPFRVVFAADHALGMSASLKAGLAMVEPGCEGVFVFLGDMPLVPVELPKALAAHLADGAVAAAPVWRGRRGHPVLFGDPLFADIARLEGDEGARRVLEGLGARLALVPATDAGVLFDIDAPGDIYALD